MVVEDHTLPGWPPIGAPLNLPREDQHWSDFDSSVNAVSFGFVATAILISMFLIMAIFERFLRPPSPSSSAAARRSGSAAGGDLESQQMGKLGYPSPKMSIYSSGVSVLMPGDEIPTFIAHPAPVPCCPERVSWPSHEHKTLPSSTSNTLSVINQV